MTQKQTAEATQELLKARKWTVVKWPSQSGSSRSLEIKLKAKRFTNKQEQKVSEVKVRQREETPVGSIW